MIVIVITHDKGGTGKTTNAVNLSSYFAMRGKNVTLIDADPSGNATLSLDFKKTPGLYDLLVRDAQWDQVRREVKPTTYEHPDMRSTGHLFIVPSNVETKNIAGAITDPFTIAYRLAELESEMDYAIIDTSPTPAALNALIYLATDTIFYPTLLEALSFDGLVEGLQHRTEASRARSKQGLGGIHILGIQPMMYLASTGEHQDNLLDLKNQFKELVLPPISQRTAWVQASRLHKSIFAHAPKNIAAKEALAAAEAVERRLGDA